MTAKAQQTADLATAAKVWARRTGRALNLSDVRDLKAERGYTCSEHAALRAAIADAKATGEYALVAR